MPKDKYTEEINNLSSEISNIGDVWELYYKRGYYYFLAADEEKAKDDYKHALVLGLDPTNYPYYAFSNSNELRRDFILPEKILVLLILVIVTIALFMQIAGFVLKLKGIL